tara:strand:- start:82 stop:300 length:219 start_codon:yes stop_codon:yes gene_type:complete
MRDISSPILFADACDQFEAEILPFIQEQYEQDGEPDWPARREAWNNWTDMLCKDALISDWQYHNWTHPRCCG